VKVGGGHTSGAKRAAPLFLALTISRSDERFRGGQYTLICCFSTHGAPSAQRFV